VSPESGAGGADPEVDPGVDPEVLEELELWSGPEDPGPEDADPDGPPASGAVVLVGTPIGNLGDLSPRAVEALRTADVVYCEDTRHTRKLLTHAGLTGTPLRSLHEHNEGDRIAGVLRLVGNGGTAAVVSDAGMPGISDPGSRLVAAAAEAGLRVTVVPGPSAVLGALVVSGLATDRFCFEGFLPRSGRDRKERIGKLVGETRTSVLFEAPGRVAATVRDLAQAGDPNRQVVIVRELTKVHEEVWRGSLLEAESWVAAHPVRGEVVLVLAGAPEVEDAPVSDEVLSAALAERLDRGERTRGVVDDLAAVYGVPRRRVYDLALARSSADSAQPSGPVGTGSPGQAPGPPGSGAPVR
jgi:16S rRNA (cytidine1402-2'-O)-methyltransferase